MKEDGEREYIGRASVGGKNKHILKGKSDRVNDLSFMRGSFSLPRRKRRRRRTEELSV